MRVKELLLTFNVIIFQKGSRKLAKKTVESTSSSPSEEKAGAKNQAAPPLNITETSSKSIPEKGKEIVIACDNFTKGDVVAEEADVDVELTDVDTALEVSQAEQRNRLPSQTETEEQTSCHNKLKSDVKYESICNTTSKSIGNEKAKANIDEVKTITTDCAVETIDVSRDKTVELFNNTTDERKVKIVINDNNIDDNAKNIVEQPAAGYAIY